MKKSFVKWHPSYMLKSLTNHNSSHQAPARLPAPSWPGPPGPAPSGLSARLVCSAAPGPVLSGLPGLSASFSGLVASSSVGEVRPAALPPSRTESVPSTHPCIRATRLCISIRPCIYASGRVHASACPSSSVPGASGQVGSWRICSDSRAVRNAS